jgi:hypothetical protein
MSLAARILASRKADREAMLGISIASQRLLKNKVLFPTRSPENITIKYPR